MVLSLECLGAGDAHVLPLVAVRQLVLGQRRRIAEHFVANLKQTITCLLERSLQSLILSKLRPNRYQAKFLVKKIFVIDYFIYITAQRKSITI